MKTFKTITALFIAMVMSVSAFAGNIIITEKNGQKQEVEVKTRDVKSKGVKTGIEAMTYFENISSVSTDDFDIHERLIKKTEKRYRHIEINYTGSESIHSLRLKKLQRKKKGSDVTRTAGGIMTIIGILSGDRNLTAVGVATNVAGHIAKDHNQSNTNDVHTDMLNDLDRRTKEIEAKSEELKLKQAYGVENVEGLKALIDKQYEKATALANAGELSENEDYRISAIFLKAMIATDQNNFEEANKVFERLVEEDEEITSVDEAKKETAFLLNELEKLRDPQ